MLELAIAHALNDPTRNLFGQHGPRCAHCSGLGKLLGFPSDGRVTRYAHRCSCEGSGLDVVGLQRQQISSLIQKMESLDRRAVRDATRLNAALLQLRGGKLKMSRQSWQELISCATADGAAVANTTNEAIVMPNITLPANYLQDGRRLRHTLKGKLSTTGTPTLIFAVRWNGVAGTILAQSEPITMGSGVTNVIWSLKYEIQVRSNGATGTVVVFCELLINTATTTTVPHLFGVSGFDAPAAVAVDLTADTPLSVTADWSAASASNTLTGMESALESLN